MLPVKDGQCPKAAAIGIHQDLAGAMVRIIRFSFISAIEKWQIALE
jgi:hypothetical protein